MCRFLSFVRKVFRADSFTSIEGVFPPFEGFIVTPAQKLFTRWIKANNKRDKSQIECVQSQDFFGEKGTSYPSMAYRGVKPVFNSLLALRQSVRSPSAKRRGFDRGSYREHRTQLRDLLVSNRRTALCRQA